MKRVLEIFDCTAVDAATLSSLVAGGMADLALILSAPSRGAHLSAADSAACAAAAGQWSAALQTLLGEYQTSIYFPRYTPRNPPPLPLLPPHLRHVLSNLASSADMIGLVPHDLRYHFAPQRLCRPPPKGSSLYQRLLVLGRGAMAYGKFSVARECFEAAGTAQLFCYSLPDCPHTIPDACLAYTATSQLH